MIKPREKSCGKSLGPTEIKMRKHNSELKILFKSTITVINLKKKKKNAFNVSIN